MNADPSGSTYLHGLCRSSKRSSSEPEARTSKRVIRPPDKLDPDATTPTRIVKKVILADKSLFLSTLCLPIYYTMNRLETNSVFKDLLHTFSIKSSYSLQQLIVSIFFTETTHLIFFFFKSGIYIMQINMVGEGGIAAEGKK